MKIKRCSPESALVCPYRRYCEPAAGYTDGSECDRFNEAVARVINARFESGMAELSDWLDKHPEALTMGGAPNV